MKKRRWVSLLPHLFTLSSIFCGLYAVIVATGGDSNQRFIKAAVAIIFAVLFDSVDGRVARATRTQSDFGIQLDSLADVISFGVAPAVLAYEWSLSAYGLVGLLAAFVYCTCGAVRLARFNVLAASPRGTRHFVGLPIPLAASNLSALVLLHARISGGGQTGPQPLVVVVVLLLAALMVSRIRYRAFKAAGVKQTASLIVLLGALALIAALKTGFAIMFTAVVGAMLALGPAEELVRLVRRRSPRARQASEDDKPER